MTTKTITITQEAYESIKSIKSKDESFSEFFLKVSREKWRVKNLLGIFGSSEEDAKDMQTRLKKNREELSNNMEERERVLARQLGDH